MPHIRTRNLSRHGWLTATLAAMCLGCGGGGTGSTQPPTFVEQFVPPSLVGARVDAIPTPVLGGQRPVVTPGAAPDVVIDSVAPYSGEVNPVGTGIYQPVTQFVTGRVFNVSPNAARVVVYATTNQAYIQPLNNCFSPISVDTAMNEDVWYGFASAGSITVLLVSNLYAAPQGFPASSPPVVDGVDVLALATG